MGKENQGENNPEHLPTEPDASTAVGDRIWVGDHGQVKGGVRTSMICTKKAVVVTSIDKGEAPWLYSTKCEGCEDIPAVMFDPSKSS